MGNALLSADGLERGFGLSAPAGSCNFGACLGDDGRFLGALVSGMVTPVQQPRNDASGADGDRCNGP